MRLGVLILDHLVRVSDSREAPGASVWA
jgi:hypothetical protein